MMNATGALIAANTAAASAAGANDEVLSTSELIRLLEQNAGFAQALVSAGTAQSQPAADPAATAQLPTTHVRSDDDKAADDEAPCDIATLIRLLEQQAQPIVATAGALGSSTPMPPATMATAVPPAASDRGGDAARSSAKPTAGSSPAAGIPLLAGAAGDDISSLLAVSVAATTAAGADATRSATARESGTLNVPDATPHAGDPAQMTLSMAQSFKTEMPASPPVERVIHVPVRDPAWPQAVAAEIQFLSSQNVDSATLRLSPEHLGPLEVHIDVHDGNVNISFGVAHGDTQAALEQAMPRLREMFAAAGLNLGQASVQQETRRGSHNGSAAPTPVAAVGDNSAGAAGGAVRALGLVDEYA